MNNYMKNEPENQSPIINEEPSFFSMEQEMEPIIEELTELFITIQNSGLTDSGDESDVTNLLDRLPQSSGTAIKLLLAGEVEELNNDFKFSPEVLLGMMISLSQAEKQGEELDFSLEGFEGIQQILTEAFEIEFDVTHNQFSTLLTDVSNQLPLLSEVADTKLPTKLNNISNHRVYQLLNHEISEPVVEEVAQIIEIKASNQVQEQIVEDPLMNNRIEIPMQATPIGPLHSNEDVELTYNKLSQLVKEILPTETENLPDIETVSSKLIEKIEQLSIEKGTAAAFLGQLLRRINLESSQVNNNKGNQAIQEFDGIVEQLLPDISKQGSLATKNNDQAKMISDILTAAIQSLDASSGQIETGKPVLHSENTPMTKIQQFVIHVGQNSTESQAKTRQEFIQQFYDIVNAGKFRATTNGHSQMVIKFKPDHLGSVIVKLSQINGEFTARIITASKAAQELVESNISQLRAHFSAQNITVDRLETYSQEQYQGLLKDSDQSGTKKEQQDESGRKNESELNKTEDAFSDHLLEEIVNLQV
ncbi:flagellar hook-length control protein FliK [Bacillus sp. PS06]|uniref:flagellar hook-length control protein FliK n=1 Tax=Bacillus sp. PS06 TaxID=2764176 RepID=UPI00177BD667|nr:flagellar hook-length control protein FliK [Bacillus sp. PS06]MBD8068296.1 flagellar hook-length control protein FliK [Bacillus sp. PS06]